MPDRPGAADPEIANFHHWNPEHQEDPNPFFDRVRNTCPVAWSNKHEGFWLLTKYEDVYRAYQEPILFSAFPNAIPAAGWGNARPVIPTESDPPEHTHYREILAPLFTAHRMRTLETRILEHTQDLIAAIKEKGECNFAAEFAQELPARVFLEMMGWPITDAAMFLRWCDAMMRDIPGDPEATAASKAQAAGELYGYFNAELDGRDAAGLPDRGDKADFIDWLRSARFAGERPLTRNEILDIIFIVLIAGLDTTQGVLSLSIEFLANNPEYRRDLVENPDLVQSAVEELLRWFAPVLPGRRLTEDFELRGVKMNKGERVMLSTTSACRDEDEFENAGTVDLRRNPNRHIAFGVGAHRCLGSHLARVELRTALAEWHKEIPEYRVKAGAPNRKHLSAVRGVDELWLELG
jgi:hypothetical protein